MRIGIQAPGIVLSDWNLIFICAVILVSGAVFFGNKVLPKFIGRPVHPSVLPVLANREGAPTEL